jgi:hypothetical protein
MMRIQAMGALAMHNDVEATCVVTAATRCNSEYVARLQLSAGTDKEKPDVLTVTPARALIQLRARTQCHLLQQMRMFISIEIGLRGEFPAIVWQNHHCSFDDNNHRFAHVLLNISRTPGRLCMFHHWYQRTIN